MSARLAVDPACLKFGRKDEDRLRETLERIDRTSDLFPVTDLAGLTMRPDGTLPGKLRFTTLALYQLTKLACPGLYGVLQQLTADGEETSVLAAVALFNQVVKLRFRDRLLGKRLLLDRPAGTVEAVVSAKFRLVPNTEAYGEISSAVSNVQGASFYEGRLNGRWLLLRYFVRGDHLDAGGQRYHAGFHFSNHEGGHASMRGLNSLVRAHGRLCMLAPPGGRGVRHAGAKVRDRFRAMVSRVLFYRHDSVALCQGLEALSVQKLGLGLQSAEAETRRLKELRAQLCRRGLGQSFSDRALARALLQPHDVDEPRTALALTSKDHAKCTALDLAAAMCRESVHCAINLREAVEQEAYALAAGRYKLR